MHWGAISAKEERSPAATVLGIFNCLLGIQRNLSRVKATGPVQSTAETAI